MKKKITIEVLHNEVTNNLIISIVKGDSQSCVTLPKELHQSLHALLLSELKSK